MRLVLPLGRLKKSNASDHRRIDAHRQLIFCAKCYANSFHESELFLPSLDRPAAESMSCSPGAGTEVLKEPSRLDSLGSFNSSHEESSLNPHALKCAKIVYSTGSEVTEGFLCEEGGDKDCLQHHTTHVCHAGVPVSGVRQEDVFHDEVMPTAEDTGLSVQGVTQTGSDEETQGLGESGELCADAPVKAPAAASPLPPGGGREAQHVTAQVSSRGTCQQEDIMSSVQDSRSLDEVTQACRPGHSHHHRATASGSLELEGTVSRDGDLTHFTATDLEHRIKLSSRGAVETELPCAVQKQAELDPSGGSPGGPRPQVDIPQIDPSVLLELQRSTQAVARSVELMMRRVCRSIQSMTALSVGYIQTYRDSVDSVGESVDMSIKAMYTLIARCEELDRSMESLQSLASQIRDIKNTLETLETLCK